MHRLLQLLWDKRVRSQRASKYVPLSPPCWRGGETPRTSITIQFISLCWRLIALLRMCDSFRASLAAQFRSGAHAADVRIRFHLERTPEQQRQQQAPPDAVGPAGGAPAAGLHFVGEPLSAHKVLLAAGSTLFHAKLSNPCWQGRAAGEVSSGVQTEDMDGLSGKKRRASSTDQLSAGPIVPTDDGPAPAVSEVLVPLSSEAEVPFARQAIEFIYTGKLSEGLGMRALLGVRQQACYLGVEHCPQACDQAMLAVLQAEQWQQQLQQVMYRASTRTGGATARPQVLEAYACHALFPEPGTSPDAASFQPVRSALAKQLVSHFGDAVAALTRPDLYRQLLQLPAVAVRELLAADDFGTDSEDSVFLLLAAWLADQQEGGVTEQTRAELCGLVRLHRLRPLYLNYVLPVYEPFSACGRVELALLLRYVGAGEHERTVLLDMDGKRRLSPWYCSPARRQVVPKKGRTVEWSISREQLEGGLRDMVKNKKVACVCACFGASMAAVSAGAGSAVSSILSHGGLWGVQLGLDPAVPTAAGIYVLVVAPQQLGKVQGVVALTDIQLAVHSWAQGRRKAGWTGEFTSANVVQAGGGLGWATALTLPPAAASATEGERSATGWKGWKAKFTSANLVLAGFGWGWPEALTLPQVAADGAGGEASAAAGGVEAEVAAHLASWSEWIHEGKITGSITLPRH